MKRISSAADRPEPIRRPDRVSGCDPSEKAGARHTHRWLAGIVLLGLILRLIRLGTHAFWQDEVHNLVKAEHLKEVVFHGELVSNHPPLPTVLLVMWRVAGLWQNEWTIRMLPVVIGVCTIVAVYAVGKQFFGSRAGLCAAFLLAVSPFHVVHSQDLKEYILLPLTGTLAILALHKAFTANRPRWWALYSLTATVACYSEYHAGPLLFAANLWVMAQLPWRTDRLRGWFVANLAAVVLFLPHAGVMLYKTRSIMVEVEDWWVERPTVWTIAFYLKSLAFGYSDSEPYFQIALVVFVLFAGAGLIMCLKRDAAAALLTAVWFAVPIGVVFALSWVLNSIFLTRALLPYGIPFYLWIGAALAGIRVRTVRYAAVLGFGCMAAMPLVQHYLREYPVHESPHRPGVHPPIAFDEAARYVDAHWEEGDVVVHGSPPTWFPFYWYGFRGRPQVTVGTGQRHIDFILTSNPHTTTLEEFSGWYIRQVQSAVDGKDRVWYVFSEWEREHLWYSPTSAWLWLDAHYVETAHEAIGGLEVFLFSRVAEGSPLRVVRRDKDDGARAEVWIAGDGDGPYVKTRPDSGLIPSSPDERRGRLTLRFGQRAGAATNLGSSQAAGGRLVAFDVENRSDAPVTCCIECLACDALLELASLYEEDPSSDTWQVASLSTPDRASASCDNPVLSGQFTTPEQAGLHGVVSLPPGEYYTFTRARGLQEEETGGAKVSLDVAGETVFAMNAGPYDRRDALTWGWFASGRVHVAEPMAKEACPVRLSSRSDEDTYWSAADVAYVAFSTAVRGGIGSAVVTQDDVTIPPHETRGTVLAVRSEARRVDVWVHENGEDGRVYRIFDATL